MTQPMPPRVLGRYLFYAPIASGGMATVYLARMAGPKGFSRVVAIKQLHAQLVHDADFVTMFIDEAHLIGRIHHSNVVAPIDVLEADGDLCIVMEYVHGEALGRLMRLSRQDHIPLRVVAAIMVQTLLGLHAAHEVTDADGQPLSVVHLDVSPQNILVGEDGITRVVDFGIAQAAHRARPADDGKLKGKLGYMAPEQLMAGELDRRSDVFAAGIILWEMLTGKRLFVSEGPVDAAERMSRFEPSAPSSIVSALSPELDAITTKALSVDPNGRFANAHDMARALEVACAPAGAIEVAEWVTRLVGDTLSMRAQWISELVGMDLSEWTQSYVMSSSLPAIANAGAFTGREQPKGMPVSVDVLPAPSTPSDVPRNTTPKHATQFTRPVGLSYLGPKLPMLRRGATVMVVLAFSAAAVFIARRPRTAPQSTHREVTIMAASPQASSAPSAMTSNSGQAPAAAPAESALAEKPPVVPLATQPTVESHAQSDCKVPYVIDAKHIKRFRPECFRKR
jgi:eukaryotic-like serine/threonine-protein kinase